MVATPGLTVIDSPIFVIDLRYSRDRNYSANRSFLDQAAREGNAATTIFNLLEVCGIMSFNLNGRQLKELFHYFPQRYNVEVFPHADFDAPLPTLRTDDLFNTIAKKSGLGDALILSTVEKHVPGAARFVSWNARHFKGRLPIRTWPSRAFH